MASRIQIRCAAVLASVAFGASLAGIPNPFAICAAIGWLILAVLFVAVTRAESRDAHRDEGGDDVGLAVFVEDTAEDEAFCRCQSCESGVVVDGHCIDIDLSALHDCVALETAVAPTLFEEHIGEKLTVTLDNSTATFTPDEPVVWVYHLPRPANPDAPPEVASGPVNLGPRPLCRGCIEAYADRRPQDVCELCAPRMLGART